MRLLLTRPRDDSEALAALLATRGHQCLVEPLIEVVFRPDAPLDFAGAQAVLLTSANGARAVAGRTEAHALPAFAVGAATAEAARRAGFERVESADGDVNSLAALVAARLKPEDGALLHVSGHVVAGDLAAALPAFEVRRAVLYEAEAAKDLSGTTAAALRAGEVDGALLFSPRTAAILAELAQKAGLAEAFRGVTAFCLSEAVAEAARPLPWRRLAVAARPEQSALLDLLEGEHGVSEPSQPAPRRSASPIAWMAGAAVLAFLLGLAAWPLLSPALQPHLPESLRDPSASRVAELEARLAALENRPAPAAPSAAEQVDPLARRIATLERELATLAARPQPQPQAASIDPRLIERLDRVEAGLARLDELEATLKKGESIDARLAELDEARERASAAGRNSALLAALSQLREAMRAGRPYDAALKAAATLARGEDSALAEALAPLQARAAQGLPTAAALSARFEQLAGEAAHHASLEPEAGWTDRALHRLSGLVRVRRTGAEPVEEGPEARIARAEARLKGGDLAGAVEAAGGVERRTEALERWLADARARIEADAALDALQARVIAKADGA
jgi:uroporphyrinogen-III synthase